ncbi:autophagy-related 10 [Lycorma delicatula]|uniref:autophagy-related 10 n=1 Tax=Lycorma delicatula TaxID=130591 RepID=UPI003F50DD4F
MSSCVIGINNNNCFMSWDDFINYCELFIKISNKINDGWIFYNKNEINSVGESYLLKKVAKIINNPSVTIKKQYDSNSENIDVNNSEGDCNEYNVKNGTELVFWEYHILYSPSYGAPSLYFNAWKRNGHILTIDEINKQSINYNDNKICIISQQEHPLLHRPFYFVHPCDTIAILQSHKSITSSKTSCSGNSSVCGNPLVTWLSTIASAVQIDLSYEYVSSS